MQTSTKDDAQHAEAQALIEHYALHFAGRPRATRDRALLSALIERLAALDGCHKALKTSWEEELQAIAHEQESLGAEGQMRHRAAERAQIVLMRLSFVISEGHEGDKGALALGRIQAEAIDAATAIAASLPEDTRPRLGQAENSMGQRSKTEGLCINAWRALMNVKDQASTLEQRLHDHWQHGSALSRARLGARVAQALHTSFNQRIVGRNRLVVRPTLLGELADDLEHVQRHMVALVGDDIEPLSHHENCQILLAHAEAWREEQKTSQSVRQQATPDELVHALLVETDTILAAVDDAPSDADVILYQRMDEVLRQLWDVTLLPGMGHQQQSVLGVQDSLMFLINRLENGLFVKPSAVPKFVDEQKAEKDASEPSRI